jgi:PhnB protein
MAERKPAPLSPYLVVHDGHAALDFYKHAFDATVIDTYPYEGKLGHATLAINGGEIMLSDEFPVEITGVRTPKSLGGTTTTISLAVNDADAWFDRAIAAGATVLRPLNDEFYGRMGKLVDPYGHCWSIVGPAKTK